MSVFAKTALGTKVEVTFCDDCGDNKGGYYCQVYLANCDDDEIDNFVIDAEDLKDATEEELAIKYIKSVKVY
jgi:hypothetical protein